MDLGEILSILAGIISLYYGGHLLVSSSVALAIRFSIPRYVIGGTIVAIGTSMPEFFSVLAAASRKESILVFSSLIGSNIFNIAAVFSIGILIQKKIVPPTKISIQNASILLLAAVLPLLFSFGITRGQLDWIEGGIFLLFFLLYIAVIICRKESPLPSLADDPNTPQPSKGQEPSKGQDSSFGTLSTNAAIFTKVLLVIGAIIILMVGGELVVRPIQSILNRMNRSTQLARFLAVSIMAVGTSLPELVTSFVSLKKQENDVMFGTIVGSCIVNTLFILPIATFIFPIRIDSQLIVDAVYVLVLHIWLLSLSYYTPRRFLFRLQGFLALGSITGYLYFLASALRL